MASLNEVSLIGNLGRDPDISFKPDGTCVARLSVGTDESYNEKTTGAKVDAVEWHRVVLFGRRAEVAQQYLRKGAKVYIKGKLKTSKWEKDGIERSSTDIVANDMKMLGGKAGQQPQQPQHPQHPQQQNTTYGNAPGSLGYWNTDGTACGPQQNQALRNAGFNYWQQGSKPPMAALQITGVY